MSKMATITNTKGINANLVAIDTWLGAPEFWTRGVCNKDPDRCLRLINGYPSIFYKFTKNMKALGFDDCVCPFPISSIQGRDVLATFKIQADIIYIDAAHEYKAVYSDIESFWEILKPGGFMFGDDYNSCWLGVIKAVDEFVGKHNLQLNLEEGVWCIRKPSD